MSVGGLLASTTVLFTVIAGLYQHDDGGSVSMIPVSAVLQAVVAVGAVIIVATLILPQYAVTEVRDLLAVGVEQTAILLTRHAAAVCGAMTLSSYADASAFTRDTLLASHTRIKKMLGFAEYEHLFAIGNATEPLEGLHDISVAAEAVTIRVLALTRATEQFESIRPETFQVWWGDLLPFWQEVYRDACLTLAVISRIILDNSNVEPIPHFHISKSLRDRYHEATEHILRHNFETVTSSTSIAPAQEIQLLFFIAVYSFRVFNGIVHLCDAAAMLRERRNQKRSILWRLRATARGLVVIIEPVLHFAKKMRILITEIRHPSHLLDDRSFLYIIKIMLAIMSILIPTIVQSSRTFMRNIQSSWILVTIVIVFQKTFDATLFKAALRLLGTVVAAGLSFLIAWHPIPGSNPYILMTFMLVGTFVAVYMAQGTFLYAWMLFGFTLIVVVSCQYVPDCACATLVFAVTRCICIAVGGLIALAVNGAIFPVIAVYDLRAYVAKTIEKCAALFVTLTKRYVTAERAEAASHDEGAIHRTVCNNYTYPTYVLMCIEIVIG